MSKAEKRALEKYPADKSVFDKYEKQRYAYICGYIQAEKDLELTWEDIERIDDISIRLDCTEEPKEMSNKEFYTEILKRFKEFKERKEK